MKAFVSDVDAPIGHALSLLLANTPVGSHRPASPDEGTNEDTDAPPKPKATSEPYQVVGSLCYSLREEDDVPDEMRTDARDPVGKSKGTRQLMSAVPVAGKSGEWMAQSFKKEDTEQLKAALLESDVIVIDFLKSVDQVQWMITLLEDNAAMFVDRPKTIVGVSSIMSWAKTKPVDPDDTETPIAEDEYRRRKPHPNFRTHVQLEKEFVKLAKKGCYTPYVVFAGHPYHIGDSIFHYMLQSAWLGEKEVIVYGDGQNFLPMIHIDDLASVVVQLVEMTPDGKYFVALDDARSTYEDIAKAISATLGTGRIKCVPKEEALMRRDFTQTDYDMLTVNIRLDARNVKSLEPKWEYESGLVENVERFVREYKEGRGLTPLKIAVHGPPASGKTYYAKKLAKHYQIHLIDVDSVVKETIANMVPFRDGSPLAIAWADHVVGNQERRVNHANNSSGDEEQDENVDADRELLEELSEAAKNNNGKYPETHVVNFLRAKLSSMPCQNQGFVLDGYPTTTQEAMVLFKKDDDEEEPDPEHPGAKQTLLPEFVLALECSDEFIRDRVMHLPEEEVANTRNAEEALMRRLEEYRAQSTDDKTILNYYDELEVHPFVIHVDKPAATPVMSGAGSTSSSTVAAPAAVAASAEGTAAPRSQLQQQDMTIFDQMKRVLGKPHNYGPSAEDIARKKRQLEEAKARAAEQARAEKSRMDAEEAERQSKALTEWAREVRKQEQEVLEAQSVPLRNYLMKHVMPTLTTALIDVCKVRPEDPIDYLAEYLFRHNPAAQ
ncbi:hypothetical protein RI367_001800 [Sorochytrium milnesiophthora]